MEARVVSLTLRQGLRVGTTPLADQAAFVIDGTLPSLCHPVIPRQAAGIDQFELRTMIEQAVIKATQEVFTRQEAAEFLRIGESTLDDLVRRALIVPNRATRRPLYLRTELLRFMREGTAAVDL